MKYKTAKRLALLWLKLKLVFWLLLSSGCVAAGVYFATGWGIIASLGIGAAVSVFIFCFEEHPQTDIDRAVIKFPFSGLTDSQSQTKHRQ